jgi:pseudouridylate synthase
LRESGISGKEVTPFLLARMAAHSNGKTILSNRRLLENNAALASVISLTLQKYTN